MLNTGFLLLKLAAALPNANFIAPDLRGCGQSSNNKNISCLEDFADDVKLFLDALNIDKVILIGTCLGGYASGVFAARYPQKLESLILVGPLTFLGGAHMFYGDYPKKYDEIDNTPHMHIVHVMDGKHNE